MPVRGPVFEFLICVAIAAVWIGCAKAEFDPPDSAPPPEKDGPVCSVSSATCTDDIGCAACEQKCSYVVGPSGIDIQASCVTPDGDLGEFEECHIQREGTKDQSDDCGPGQICLRPSGSEEVKFCFRLCATSADCIRAECGSRPLFSAGPPVNVCDPPYVQVGAGACDPLVGNSCGDGRYCFLVQGDDLGHSRTVCEYSMGNGRDEPPPPAECQSARDCFFQFTCVDGACRRVCQGGSTCDSGKMCVAMGAEYGYCP